MHILKNLYGVAYSTSIESDNYCKDWYSTDKQSIYKNSNRNLSSIKELGFNHIRTYYLDPNIDHSDFLQHCDSLNLTIEIGISNNLLDSRDFAAVDKIINNVKKFNCVKIYTVGNEYFGNIDNIIAVIEHVYSVDGNKHIMHSSIFDQNFNTAKLIYNKIPNHIKSKYIVGLNIYLYSNPASQHGDVLQNIMKEYYADPVLSNSYLVISEFGNNKDHEQYCSLWNFLWGNKVCLQNYEKYLGFSLFSYSNEKWKGDHNGENNYGILSENGNPKDGYYAIKQFKGN